MSRHLLSLDNIQRLFFLIQTLQTTMKIDFLKQPTISTRFALGSVLVLTTVSVSLSAVSDAKATVRRALHVRRTVGSVTTLAGYRKRTQPGDQLTDVGHGIITGRRASANLRIDGGSGSIAVAQNTHMTVERLSVSPNGGYVTVLDVERGQARVQVRPFTNPSSRFELRTPSGVAAVRGTEFGVSVSEAGKTGIATLEGKVEASAQFVEVPVEAGMVSVIRPGEIPTPAKPLDRTLDIQWKRYEWKDNQLYIEGYVDAANLLFVAGNEIPVNRAGYFKAEIRLKKRTHRVKATVKNAVGETRNHHLFRWITHRFDT
ncbi:MAG: FecR domain-containing protein [Cyanobacteria bacterium P01_D01_bin.156]